MPVFQYDWIMEACLCFFSFTDCIFFFFEGAKINPFFLKIDVCHPTAASFIVTNAGVPTCIVCPWFL